MPVKERCSYCQASGFFKCDECLCSRCNGRGSVSQTCSKCSGSKTVPCKSCQATGRVLVKKGWFSDTYGPCRSCSGSGKEKCGCYNGNVSVKCSSCQGSGRNSNCDHCDGTGKLECSDCDGAGWVQSEWARSLGRMSAKQLEFEHQKRQRQLSVLEMKRIALQQKYDAIQEQWAEETRYFSTSKEWHDYQPPSTTGVERDQSDVAGEMSILNSEIEAIEKALESKW